MTGTVAAIVLAGGRSTRFGRDKLREVIDGRPLIDHAIDAVRAVADEILVVGGVEGAPPSSVDVRVVRDHRPFEGPLAALATGLAVTAAERVLVVGGDMPSLVPAVLARLIAALDDPVMDGAVLESGGHHRPLPMTVRRAVAAPLAMALVSGGERRLRALRDGLRIAAIPDEAWLQDDPAGDTLRDIDTPADLGT